MNNIIDGKALANEILADLKLEIQELKSQTNASPKLAIVLVGDNPASIIYVKNKIKNAHKIGIDTLLVNLSTTIHTDDLIAKINELNLDNEISGIIVQLPLPNSIDKNKILSAVSPYKDIDGFHPLNVGYLHSGIIVRPVGFNYKEQGAKPIDNRRATSDDGSEFKSFDYNWHIWLDLDNVRILLQEFARIFSEKLPELQEDINNNLSIALKELNKLQEIKNNELRAIKDVILLSDSSEYFFVNTNIKTAKLYSESQKSLRYIRKLEDLIKESNNKCLVLSSEQNSRLYDKLNAKIIILNSENWNVKNINSSTFQNQYLQMINQVKKCLY